MNWDFAWVADPSAWVGLGVLILLELALGIDNLLFISLLAGRLPRNSRKKAFRMGMGLALIQRFALLSMMAWLMGLREPLFTMLGRGFAVRDIILVAGGVFLLFKGSQELHDKLEDAGDHGENSGGGAGFWIVVIQIAALDAFFSFDSVLTAVGMANDVTMMMTAVAVAMAIMLRAASCLSAFVERYPSIVVMCLGFMMMVGGSLIMDGMGLPVPRGYLYAAVLFSLFVEAFRQLMVRRRRSRRVTRDSRGALADAVSRLLSLGELSSGEAQLEMAALAADAGKAGVCAKKERELLARILRLGGLSVRTIMIPWRNVDKIHASASWEEMKVAAGHSLQACIPVFDEASDDVLGAVFPQDMIARERKSAGLRAAELARPVPVVLEHTHVTDMWDILADAAGPLAVVLDEYGRPAGIVTPEHVVRALAGGAENREEAKLSGTELVLAGGMPLPEAVSALKLEHGEDFRSETLAGMVLEILGRIPHEGESFSWGGWRWRVLGMDGLRIARLGLRREGESAAEG